MTSDAGRLDANVDYGNASGFFVRIDIELPTDALYPANKDGGINGWLGLTPDEAEAFAARLVDMAERARTEGQGPA